MFLQDEALLKRIERLNWVLLLVLGPGSFVLVSRPIALGVILGGALAIANFYLMRRHLTRALDPRRKGRVRFFYLFKYYLRFAALGVIIAVLLIKEWAHPFGLLFGLSINVIGIVLVGLNEVRKLTLKGVV
ncbi:MAG TPA: ATP synthase subunit I [Syntrophobacteria bacterium]|nr:ATP synthase subunit I [Syntrophobacteria bacterium]